jgi:uncharacterized damage-inducible protein DinB
MTPGEVASLIHHMEWADALIWKAALGVASLEQERQLRERLHHFHSTQRAYLQMWRGEALSILELSSFSDLRSLGRWARGYYRELRTYAGTLQEPTLRQTVEIPWAAQVVKRFGSAGPATMGETILQIVLHTTHHRGQVATMLRLAGGEPPMTDFIAWLWMGRPEPRWDCIEVA